MLDILINYQLSQLIDEPTRVNLKTQSIIDWFITNNSNSIVKFGVYQLSISDHSLIYAIRKIGLPKGQPRFIQCRKFKNFEESSFISSLKAARWPTVEEHDYNINNVWDSWKNVFLGILNNHAPCHNIRVRNRSSPWLTSELKKLMFERDKLKKKALISSAIEDWSIYKKRRNFVNFEIKRVKKAYYRNEIEENRGDLRKTWKILNEVIGKKSHTTTINEIQTSSGEYVNNPQDIADYLNSHFASIGSKLASEIPVTNFTKPEHYLTQVDSKFQFAKINANEVLELMKNLNLRKASGHDKISNNIIKIAAPYIFKSLTNIFNLSIKYKIFPDDWKIGKVIPLHKSGKQKDANNYRPISILSTIARVFERLMFNQFFTYLTQNKILKSRQSGFRSLHSTLTALLDMLNQWCFNIDKGMINGVIFLDLKKAFDTIDHGILLMKLSKYGVQNESLEWFKSYLSNRPQICYVNGSSSSKRLLNCGVPQGSILGPILFLIYINDLPNCLDFGVGRLFADDTSITFTGRNFEMIQNLMSSDLNKIYKWLCVNKLTLNISKTEFMLIGSRQKLSSLEGDVSLSVGGVSLSRAKTVKYLGINVDEFLTWEDHFDSVRQKVTRNLAVLKRARDVLEVGSLLSLYNAIIEPYFMYCSIAWDNISESLENKLQKLQNRAARVITKAPYTKESSQVLKQLNWCTIKEKKVKEKAILMYKIMNGLAPSYLSEIFHFSDTSNYDFRHSHLNLALPQNSSNYYRKSFAFTGAKIWNALPDDLKTAPSLSTFKTRLESTAICTT